jgi:PilZ domain
MGSVLWCSFCAPEARVSIGAGCGNKPLAMENLDHIARSTPAQTRRYRRFSLQYPVQIKAHSGARIVQVQAMSRNISVRGVLLETSLMIPQETPVSFTLTVEPNELGRPIQFVGVGKVVRVNPKPTEDGFAIAVECPQPIIQSRLGGP